MNQYTPDTERVKAAAVEVAPITGAEFDRWLERVKREAGAAALRDFASQCDSDWGEFGYFGADGMIGYADVPTMANEHADRIERGE